MVSATNDGRVTFRVYLPHAGKVEVLGDFTDWRENKSPMIRENPGWWTVSLPISAGEHQFVYLVDGAIWLADYAAHGVKMSRDGGWISRLVVQPTVHTTPSDQFAAA